MNCHHHHLLLFLSLTFLPPIFSDLAADRSALLRLQAAVRGRTLHWNNPNATPCSWKGVKCDNITNRVFELRLPSDGLRGELPPNSIGNLTELRVLSLRGNSLSGQLPSDLASCTQLENLHLQGNRFSGEIPDSFFTLRNLSRVNLAGNNFSGNLSSGFNSLIKLRILYLENNQFTGSLPDLPSLAQLRNFNVSFNGLWGSIPSSLGNFSSQSFLGTSLCGGPLVSCSSDNGNKLSSGAIAGIAVGSGVVLLLILIVSFISWRTYRGRKILPQTQRSPMPRSPVKPPEHGIWTPNPVVAAEEDNWPNINISSPKERYRMPIKNSGSDGLVFFGEDVQVFSLQELLSASAEVLGKGTVGSTYKAYFDSGVEVIVKRLKEVCLSEEEFRGKIEGVGSLIHENLEPLRGYFYGRDEKLLLYEPMTKGSLSALLHGNKKRPLSWEIRAKIALGTANGIEYLHSISPGTSHGNIKSSNIFLSDYYDARISEFGLKQLISSVSSVSNLNSYRAPEVTDLRRISQKADVYSFGVLLMELLTGRAPDDVLTGEGIGLPNLVQSVVEEYWTVQVFDPVLVGHEKVEEKMVQLLHLAVSCTARHPDGRPSMAEVSRRIKEICG